MWYTFIEFPWSWRAEPIEHSDILNIYCRRIENFIHENILADIHSSSHADHSVVPTDPERFESRSIQDSGCLRSISPSKHRA